MTAQAESWLRDLQSAVATRRLYPSTHPRVVDAMSRLTAHAQNLTADTDEYSVFVLDERLVCNDGVIETSVPLAPGVFRTLQAHGFDRLTLSRGVTGDQLATLVDQLTLAESSQTAALHATPGVRFSRLMDGDAAGVRRGDGRSPLVSLWKDIADRRTCQLDVLEGMVLAFGQTLRTHQGSLVPLVRLTSHDAYTVTHIANVALLAMATGEALGLNAAFVHDLGMAALLHDIGKLRVPPEVLNAPGRLNEAELALMKKHPEDGVRLLMATANVPDLAVIVAFEHHLDHNGGGYPAVHPGWRINLASAITHVVDVYDALRSDRPYRKGLAPDVVAQMMFADAGTVFDPALLHAFYDRVASRLTEGSPDAFALGAPA